MRNPHAVWRFKGDEEIRESFQAKHDIGQNPDAVEWTTVTIRCSGKLHELAWYPRGRIVLLDHTKAEVRAQRTLQKLGDTTCGCLNAVDDIVKAFKTGDYSEVNKGFKNIAITGLTVKSCRHHWKRDEKHPHERRPGLRHQSVAMPIRGNDYRSVLSRHWRDKCFEGARVRSGIPWLAGQLKEVAVSAIAAGITPEAWMSFSPYLRGNTFVCDSKVNIAIGLDFARVSNLGMFISSCSDSACGVALVLKVESYDRDHDEYTVVASVPKRGENPDGLPENKGMEGLRGAHMSVRRMVASKVMKTDPDSGWTLREQEVACRQ